MKLAAAAVLLVAAGAWYWFNRPEPVLSSHVNWVCVETGERFNIPRNDVRFIPWINPNTDRETLIPISQQGETWMVNDHYAAILNDPNFAPLNKFVDTQTMRVRETPE